MRTLTIITAVSMLNVGKKLLVFLHTSVIQPQEVGTSPHKRCNQERFHSWTLVYTRFLLHSVSMSNFFAYLV